METNAQIQPDEIIYIRNELLLIIKNLDDNSVAYPISRGLFVILDKDIAENFKDNKTLWSAQTTHSGVYAVKNFNKKRVYLQQYISGHKHVTFKNKLPLDCRRDNLIGKSRTDVMRNRIGKKNTTSKYRGVHIKPDGRICATLYFKGKELWLGRWKTEEDAANMVDAANNLLIGDVAFMNFSNNKIDDKFRKLVPHFLQKREEREKKKKEKEALNNNKK